MNNLLTRIKTEFSFMRGNLLTLIVSWLFVFFTFSMTASFESPFRRALGAPPEIIGLMGSVGAMVLGLVRIPGAVIADKYGRKQIIVIMTFVITFSFLFHIFAPDWKFVLIGLVISNLSLIYQPALDAILADSVPPEKRGMGYAAVNVIPNIPTIFAPTVAGYLVDVYGTIPGMRIVYTIVFFCMLAASLVRLFFLRETLDHPKPIELGAFKVAFKDSLGAIRDAWREMPRTLRFVTAAFLISAFEEPMFRMFTSLYILDVVGVGEVELGLVTTISIATTLLLGFPFGKVVDKIGRKRSILSAYFLFIPTTLLFLSARSFPQLAIVYLIFGIGGCLIMPAYNALLADLIPKEKRGRIMGTIVTMNILATVPASAFGGFLYGASPVYPFIFTMILGIAVSLVFLFSVKEPKIREV
ncbi:MAG: MFS transporter [Candidatus Bathyarchaeota archaeon]|nr:MAG: MFS transporter [Candidatus Bathyarchaeota archaeon]